MDLFDFIFFLFSIYFVLIGLYAIMNPPQAYKYNLRISRFYLKIFKNIPILNIIAEQQVRTNQVLDLKYIRLYGFLLMLFGLLYFFIITFGS